MRSILGSLTRTAVLLIVAASAQADDTASKSESEAPTHSSSKAVVKNVVYGLKVEAPRVYLISQPMDGPNREKKRVELEFKLPDGAAVDELSLCELGNKNLMAVVKLKLGSEFQFHCLTMIAPPGGHVRDTFAFHQANFFETRDKLKILAVSGNQPAGSAFVVLGKMSPGQKNPIATVTEGVFYFSLCPWPPSDGQVTPFRAEAIVPQELAE